MALVNYFASFFFSSSLSRQALLTSSSMALVLSSVGVAVAMVAAAAGVGTGVAGSAFVGA